MSAIALNDDPSSDPPSKTWKMLVRDKVYGPYDLEKIASFVARGKITPDVMFYDDDLAKWIDYVELKRIYVDFRGKRPAQPPISYVSAVPRSEPGTGLVGFWARLAAYVMDVVILMIAGTVLRGIGLMSAYAFMAKPNDTGAILLMVAADALGWILGFVYFVGFNASHWQATPGKRAMSIHLVREDGTKMTVGRACLRQLATIVSTIPLFLGYLWMLFDDRNRTWHDMMTSTSVVHGKR